MQGLIKSLFCIGMYCLCLSSSMLVNAQNCPGFTIIGGGTATNVTCKGDDNGTISIIVNNNGAAVLASYIDGVTPPSPMIPTMVGGAVLETDTFRNLPAGIYDVIVGDNTFCTDTIEVTIEEPADLFSVVIDSANDATCGNNGYMQATTNGGWSTPNVFVWDGVDGTGAQLPGFPATVGSSISALQAGTYTVTTEDSEGCIVSDTRTITGNIPFTIDLSIISGSLPLQLGDSIDLLVTPNSPSATTQYIWLPTTDLEFLSAIGDSVRAKPCRETSYIIYALDPVQGCDAQDSITITVEGVFDPWIPNAFNPDEFDPRNNTFQVFGEGIESVDMEIYDRKGALLYKNPEGVLMGAWDGTIGSTGTQVVAGKYMYVMKIRSICGEIVSRSGGISLIR